MARGLTVREILARSEQHFAQKGVDSPRLSAQLLVAHGLNLTRLNLILDLDRPLAEPELALLRPLVARRAKGEPMAYILGKREFYGLDFLVTSDVLIPRPDSELFLDEALARFDKAAPLAAADLGSGSGCLGVTLAVRFPKALVLALDASPAALDVTQRNARAHGVWERMRFVRADFADLPSLSDLAVGGDATGPEGGVPGKVQGAGSDADKAPNLDSSPVSSSDSPTAASAPVDPEAPDMLAVWPVDAPGYDLILANPPYVSQAEYVELSPEVADFEPKSALVPGPSGLEAYPVVGRTALRALRPGGTLLAEIGWTQAEAVKALFESPEFGFCHVTVHKDLGGRERLVAARKPE
ncbi:hypothetical protein JCM15519_11330 [Fundidesulfovibrio butyratiphilus]